MKRKSDGLLFGRVVVTSVAVDQVLSRYDLGAVRRGAAGGASFNALEP